MRGNLVLVITMAMAVAGTGCGGGRGVPLAPTPMAMLEGTWVGSATDSTGSMMGAGLSRDMMGGMTWIVKGDGSTFSGTVQFPGYMGAPMMVSGTLNGRTGTFTMWAPGGTLAMMSPMWSGCAATATGTFDMDEHMAQMHGTYAGSNTCTGPFSNGQFTMMRR